MSNSALKIRFVDASPEEASTYAQELQECFQAKAPQLQVRREREDPEAMGLGGVLLAALAPGAPGIIPVVGVGATVVLAIAESIHVWLLLKGRSSKTVEVEGPEGKVRLDGKMLETVKDFLKVFTPPPSGGSKAT
jgi:hypothetical protein